MLRKKNKTKLIMCSFIHLDSTLLRSAGCFVYRQVSGVVDEPKHQPTEVHQH